MDAATPPPPSHHAEDADEENPHDDDSDHDDRRGVDAPGVAGGTDTPKRREPADVSADRFPECLR
jgi:hypothetical protein